MGKIALWIGIIGGVITIFVNADKIIGIVNDVIGPEPRFVLYQPSWTQGPNQGLFKVKFTVVNKYDSPLWLNKMQFVEGPLMAEEDPLDKKQGGEPPFKVFKYFTRVKKFKDRIKIISVKPGVPIPPAIHEIFVGERLELGPRSQVDYDLEVAVVPIVPKGTRLEWWRFSEDYIEAVLEIEYARRDGKPRNKSFPVKLRFHSKQR
jgi:hypothetical protein